MIRTHLTIAALFLCGNALAHGDGVDHASARKVQTDWGIAGDAKSVSRTIDINMSDSMRFTPDSIQVRRGETVRFRIRNGGGVLHEMVIGTLQTLERHAEAMRRMPDMQHAEAFMSHVKAGSEGEMVWNFNRAGRFAFACLIPGHYEAGMRGTIVVR